MWVAGVAEDSHGSETDFGVDQPSISNSDPPSNLVTLEELKAAGALRSSYQKHESRVIGTEAPKPDLLTFQTQVKPILRQACVSCHGAESQEGNIRIDVLDPDLFHGDDVNWWLEVFAVLSNGEMPPPDEAELAAEDRRKIVDWLSAEMQVASRVRRIEQGHSSFRRMTRYEYNYVLQDLLGLPFDFSKDLPPESTSEDGFQNSSEMLHMSTNQFGIYRDLARKALRRATVSGSRPAPIYWGVSMQAASATAWQRQAKEVEEIKQKYQDDPEKREQQLEQQAAKFRRRHNRAHYKDLSQGHTEPVSWSYGGAKYAWKPTSVRPEVPADHNFVAIIPPQQKWIVELGDQLPDEGMLQVRIRAARASVEDEFVPSLQLEFGWQASNDSAASTRISDRDIMIDAAPDNPQFYQWDIPLSEIYPRNSVRKVSKMGDTPSPSEFVKFVNSSVSRGDVQIDYVEITAPVHAQWPPASHARIFVDSADKSDEKVHARALLKGFMSRAWRREVTPSEIDQKLALFEMIRPDCDDFQHAVIEVLATVLSSPKFLYLVKIDSEQEATESLHQEELATRLSMFLWSSTPDKELMSLALQGRLNDADTLTEQVHRMLADPRSRRFSEQFVRQWLGMQLLDFLQVDRKLYRQFNPALKEAMQEEPIAFYHEILQNNDSVLDFVHADYTLVNERLAKHYGLVGVEGNHFRRVDLAPQNNRGGLLTQAGLLAMNSDGKDSHPLKRGIWMLESLLNDPPPPPPPAVPEIDLADPEIAKLTLNERMEDHRDQVACRSCHAKIDPWGIAFENFDAVGSYRKEIAGKPVDATSLLFNGQKLDGMQGLKRYLLQNRQDQFVRAMVHKMATYALGRPLTFSDRSSVDQITADVRKQGDGLATMVALIVNSELFQSK